MTTTTLALFDLAALNPPPADTCTRCGHAPATTRVHAVSNLLGIIPAAMAPTRYRDLAPVHSAPCCDACAWVLASVWWGGWFVCPCGTCNLWAHTLAAPLPGWDCTRCHEENTIVWRTPLAVAS